MLMRAMAGSVMLFSGLRAVLPPLVCGLPDLGTTDMA